MFTLVEEIILLIISDMFFRKSENELFEMIVATEKD